MYYLEVLFSFSIPPSTLAEDTPTSRNPHRTNRRSVSYTQLALIVRFLPHYPPHSPHTLFTHTTPTHTHTPHTHTHHTHTTPHHTHTHTHTHTTHTQPQPIELLPLTEEDSASFPDGPSHMTYTESKMGGARPSPSKEGGNERETRRASSRLSREQMVNI